MRVDTVRAENVESAHAIARHVMDGGARRLVFVGDPQTSPDVAERWAGVRDAVAATAGATVGPERVDVRVRVPAGFGEQDGADLVRGLQALPDALICANDELALGALGALHERGARGPRIGAGHRLGRRDGRALRRADHGPPADA